MVLRIRRRSAAVARMWRFFQQDNDFEIIPSDEAQAKEALAAPRPSNRIKVSGRTASTKSAASLPRCARIDPCPNVKEQKGRDVPAKVRHHLVLWSRTRPTALARPCGNFLLPSGIFWNAAAKEMIDSLVASQGKLAAWATLFSAKDRRFPPSPPETEADRQPLRRAEFAAADCELLHPRAMSEHAVSCWAAASGLKELVGQLRRCGIRLFLVEHTRREIRIAVARAVSPDLQPFSTAVSTRGGLPGRAATMRARISPSARRHCSSDGKDSTRRASVAFRRFTPVFLTMGRAIGRSAGRRSRRYSCSPSERETDPATARRFRSRNRRA